LAGTPALSKALNMSEIATETLDPDMDAENPPNEIEQYSPRAGLGKCFIDPKNTGTFSHAVRLIYKQEFDGGCMKKDKTHKQSQ